MTPQTQTLLILLTGVLIVIGSILWLRMHAFLALVLAAFVVAWLTPATAVYQSAVDQASMTLTSADEYQSFERDKQPVTLPANVQLAKLSAKQKVADGTPLAIRRDGRSAEKPEELGQPTNPHVIATIVGVTQDNKKQPLAVIRDLDLAVTNDGKPVKVYIQPMLDSARELSKQTVGSRVAEAFGNTAAKVGILIALASIIGKCLLESGAADRIVRTALGWFGERGAPGAFIGSGFLLGIPVFFDTVFYLMIPLGKALRLRTGRNYLLYVLTIVAGATMAHSLVPPTPGPLFVAEALGVDIGVMILAGGLVGMCTALYGYLHASVLNRFCELPLRETADFSLKDLESISQRDLSQLPSFFWSLLPIILPVILIGGYTIVGPNLTGTTKEIAKTLGDKNIALALATVVAMIVLIRQKKASRDDLAASVTQALSSGGVIILITAAGGAFGAILKQTGVATLIGELSTTDPTIVLLIAFGITVAIRTAQGSATVAMITAVGILGSIVGQLDIHPVYVALAIGCGSKPGAWMNDSGFWVITRMSGMTESEGLKYITPMTFLMGATGIAVTIAGAKLIPHPF